MSKPAVVAYRVQVIRSYNRFGSTFVEREVDTTYHVDRGEAFDPDKPPVLDDNCVAALLDIAVREQWPPPPTDAEYGMLTGRALVAHLSIVATVPGGAFGSDQHVAECTGTVFRWTVRGVDDVHLWPITGRSLIAPRRHRQGYRHSTSSELVLAFALDAIRAKTFPESGPSDDLDSPGATP